MEDRRIQKTKKSLKDALTGLLSRSPFEVITVTELCKEANVSRITFYTYYGDKYELVDDFFHDILLIATDKLNKLQQSSNPDDDPVTGYCNLLEVIIDIYFDYFDFLQHTQSEESPYLYFSFYWYIMRSIEHLTLLYGKKLQPKHSVKRTTSFLCNGLWGYIHTSRLEHADEKEIREQSKELLMDFLACDYFRKK